MTDRRLQRLCELNDVLWIERDASGWIHVKPIAGCQVSSMSIAIGGKLHGWTEGDGRGVCTSNGGFVLPDTSMFGCCLAWIPKERWEGLTINERKSFAHLCPAFVVEFLSPYDRLADMEAKMKLWISNGAQLAWLVVPKSKTVAVYRPGEPVKILKKPLSLRGSGPIAGFEMSTEKLWSEVD